MTPIVSREQVENKEKLMKTNNRNIIWDKG